MSDLYGVAWEMEVQIDELNRFFYTLHLLAQVDYIRRKCFAITIFRIKYLLRIYVEQKKKNPSFLGWGSWIVDPRACVAQVSARRWSVRVRV
jgi:hypothetical protein